MRDRVLSNRPQPCYQISRVCVSSSPFPIIVGRCLGRLRMCLCSRTRPILDTSSSVVRRCILRHLVVNVCKSMILHRPSSFSTAPNRSLILAHVTPQSQTFCYAPSIFSTVVDHPPILTDALFADIVSFLYAILNLHLPT